MLEPGAADDRGAERLVRQTRFLAAAFRDFENALRAQAGIDQHGAVQRVLATASPMPYRHVVIAVGDRALRPIGSRAGSLGSVGARPGPRTLDVVATDRVVAGAFHEAIHRLLPGIEEVRFDGEPRSTPALVRALQR